MAEMRITFNYAIIEADGYCVEVCSTSRNCDGMEGYIPIPEYSYEYMEKYYNVADNKWYYDAEFENEAAYLN